MDWCAHAQAEPLVGWPNFAAFLFARDVFSGVSGKWVARAGQSVRRPGQYSFSVPKACNFCARCGHPLQRSVYLFPIEVERSGDDVASELGGDVAGERHGYLGKVQGDASRCVPRHGKHYSSPGEVERVSIDNLKVGPTRWCIDRFDLLVDLAFSLREDR